MIYHHLALRRYCQIVSIEGTVKEMYYTVRELVISDHDLIHICTLMGI